jgi:hypothetical protein
MHTHTHIYIYIYVCVCIYIYIYVQSHIITFDQHVAVTPVTITKVPYNNKVNI